MLELLGGGIGTIIVAEDVATAPEVMLGAGMDEVDAGYPEEPDDAGTELAMALDAGAEGTFVG